MRFSSRTFITKFPEETVSFKANSIQLVNGSKLFNSVEMRIEFAHRLVIPSMFGPNCFFFLCKPMNSVSHLILLIFEVFHQLCFRQNSISFHATESMKTQNEAAKSIKFGVKLIWYRNEYLAHNKKVLC